VVGKFVEFFGAGARRAAARRPRDHRQHGPEYGATIGFFPIDQQTLDYLRAHRPRRRARSRSSRAYAKAQGLLAPTRRRRAGVHRHASSSTSSTVVPRLAGPKRPQDRIDAQQTSQPSSSSRGSTVQGGFGASPPTHRGRRRSGESDDRRRRGRDRRHHQLHQHLATPSVHDRRRPAWPRRPSSRASPRKPWVKTSLAPGSQVVTDYLDDARPRP
jgi:aconitate hydratase